MRRAALPSIALLLGCTLAIPAALARDASVERRLDARGVNYEIDGDGDYKVIYNYSQEGRSQMVFVSGTTESVAGFQVREVFAPAASLSRDGIGGKKALELLAESRSNKLGSWEIGGDILYFVVKLPDNIDAAQLEAAMDIVAQTADDMEIKLSGDLDAL